MSAPDAIGEEQAWVTAMPEALRGPALQLNAAVVEPIMNRCLRCAPSYMLPFTSVPCRIHKVEQKVRVLRDKFAPLRKERWGFAFFLLFIYFLRVYATPLLPHPFLLPLS